MGLRVCLDVFADRNQSGRKLCVHSHTGGPNGGPGGAWGGLALTCVENRLTLAQKNGTPTYVGALLYMLNGVPGFMLLPWRVYILLWSVVFGWNIILV